ncbi:hypothetical protein [Microbulbifer epialgicus]|uniref:Outer membrane protein beta-barrel domain-containing protein n=1 Tax=Microbulbifer epialgicus TaxID=393907 RepID=A0ABV4NW53_9GAMM
MARKGVAKILLCLVMLLSNCVLLAQTEPDNHPSKPEEPGSHSAARDTASLVASDWRIAITPYLFLPLRTKGQSTVAGTTVDVDLNLKKTLELLNVAFSARLEAWRGRFGLVSDLYYVNLRLKEGATIRPPRNPDLNIDINIDVDADTRQGWVAVFGVYRLLEGRFPHSGRRYFWDIGVGARWNRIKQEVEARVGVDIARMPTVSNRLGGRDSWWEPTVGTRVGVAVSDCLMLGARTEIGGFGAGGDDLQWNLLIGLDWRAWETTSLRFGYQYYSIDYSSRLSDGKFAYDIDQHGPYIAVTWRW